MLYKIYHKKIFIQKCDISYYRDIFAEASISGVTQRVHWVYKTTKLCVFLQSFE